MTGRGRPSEAVALLLPGLRRGMPWPGQRARSVALARRARATFIGAGLPRPSAGRPALAYVLFALTPVLYVGQQLLVHPRAILGGEMYAEMSTNYYAATQTLGLRLQLLAVDAGYIPLPQRIIGVIGWQLGLSPSTIPYFYTGSALVLSGLLVGAVCLPSFRPVIANDWLRFVLALALLLPLDFETRLYINFTYLIVVPAVFLSALAFVERDVPRWAWILPVLMLSKPAVLTVLPAVLLAAVVARRRFRLIAALCAAVAVVQIVRLEISSQLPGSLLQQGPESSPVEKVVVAAQYTLGYLGRLVLAPNGGQSAAAAIAGGALVLVAFVVVAAFGRSPAGVLVVCGVSVLAANMLLSTVVYSNWFNGDLSMLGMAILDRRVVVCSLGTLIAAVGVVAVVTESPLVSGLLRRIGGRLHLDLRPSVVPVLHVLAVVAVILWMATAGWLRYATLVNATIVPPSSDVSEWETMAPALTSGQPVVCVPTAPFGWLYGRNCAMISGQIPAGLNYRDVDAQSNGRHAVSLTVPDLVRTHAVAAVAVLVAPVDVERPVRATLTFTTASGDKRVLQAEERLPLSGGSLLFQANPVDLVDGTRSATISFDAPVRIGWAQEPEGQAISVLWMGQ